MAMIKVFMGKILPKIDPNKVKYLRFEVLSHTGERIGNAEDFDAAMLLHIRYYKKSGREDLVERYAGLVQAGEHLGRPLFYEEA